MFSPIHSTPNQYAENPSSNEKEKEEEIPTSISGEQPEAPVDLLSDDTLGMIFRFTTNNCKDLDTLGAIQKTHPRWQRIVDTDLLRRCWGGMQGRIEHPILRKLVDQSVFVDRFVSQILVSAICSQHPELDDVERESLLNRIGLTGPSWFSRFSLLSEELKAKGAPSSVIGFEPSAYDEMHRKLDSDLETAWGRIQRQIDFEGAPIPANAEAIRSWLNDPIHAEKIALIDRFLNLSQGNLRALPSEIGKFSQLKALQLIDNQLSFLPEAIGNLSQLTGLFLFNNQLESLPEAIGKLSQLNWLGLCNNRLKSLPETIGQLSQLRELRLSHNRLSSLPKTINKLSALSWLELSHNHFSSLPETIDDLLPKLQTLDLDGNPMMLFMMDHGNGLYRNFQDSNNKLLACSNHECHTPLASLCQQILLRKEDRVLRNTFEQISPEMQQSIRLAWAASSSPSSSSSEADAELFSDRAAFTQAVIFALQNMWVCRSEEERNRGYWHVWDLAGQPHDGDPKWGETHAWENIVRLIDAMELATQPN